MLYEPLPNICSLFMHRQYDLFHPPSPVLSTPTNKGSLFISQSRQIIQSILQGKDPRLLLIVGPCSIHDPKATIEYGIKLKKLAEEVSDHFFCVMRSYVEKPRTTLGWKGFIYDPDLNGSCDLLAGITKTQRLLQDLTDLELPLGGEILDPFTFCFYSQFLSWGCIGARTSSSPIHRQIASGLPFPVGFKNSVDGNIDTPIQGIITAREKHIFLSVQPDGQLYRMHTPGNTAGHVVLRGSIQGPNYSNSSIEHVVRKIAPTGSVRRLIIDCSHDNSGKQPERQPLAFSSVIEQIREGSSAIAGLMLESFLENGSQSPYGPLRYGVSITDGCIDWNTTETLIKTAHHQLIQISGAPLAR